MSRSYGFEPCPIDAKGTHEADQMFGSVRWESDEYDVSDLFRGEPIMDQGPSASCVRHALARAIQCCARARHSRTFELPSARHITHLTRTLLGSAWSWDGTTIAAAVEAVQDAGVIRESECPWDPSLDGQVDFDDLQKGLETCVPGNCVRSHRSFEVDDARRSVIAEGLKSGCGVLAGISVSEDFDWVRDDSIWTMKGPRKGGHAMAIVGIHDDHVVCLNSHGASSGDGGFVSVAIDHVLRPETCPSLWLVDIAPEWRAPW